MNMNQKIDKYKLTNNDYNKHLSIELVVTNICNQKCEYCHWNSSILPINNHIMTLNEFDKVLEFIDAQERETIELNFYGGEPTLNPHLPEMIDRLYTTFADQLITVNLLTNLSKNINYYKQLLKYPIGIKASYHPDNVKSPTQFALNLKEILPNLELLCVVFSEKTYKKALRLYNMFKNDIPDAITLHKIDQLPIEKARELIGDNIHNMNIYDYAETPDHLNDGVDVIKNGKKLTHDEYKDCHCFKGMICSAGFIILSTGDILKCWSDLGIRSLTNIYKDGLKKLPVWEMCRYDSCYCEKRFTKLCIKEFIKHER